MGWVGGDVPKGKLGDRVGGSWSSIRSLQTLETWNCLRDILSVAHYNPIALMHNIIYEVCAE